MISKPVSPPLLFTVFKLFHGLRSHPDKTKCPHGFHEGILMRIHMLQIRANTTKFKMNSPVTTQRIGWISLACFLQIFTMQYVMKPKAIP